MSTAKDPEAMRDRRIARHPIGRIGGADEVARVIAILNSEEANFYSETVLKIDFGWRAS